MVKKHFEIAKLFFALLFSAMLVLSMHIVMNNTDRSSLETIYFTDLKLYDLPLWLLVSAVVFFMLSKFRGIRKSMFFGDLLSSRKAWPQFIVSFCVIIACYIPYILSFWPGGVYTDTMNSIWIATGEHPFTTHEPPLYTLLWKLLYLVAGDYRFIYLFTIIQCVGMAALFASFISWNYKRGLKKWVAVLATLFFALIPIFPLYAISLWKDTVFGIIVFLYAWQLYCMMERINSISVVSTSADGTKACDISKRDLLLYLLLSVLCVFGRNNGIYVMILVSIVVVLANHKNRLVFKKLAISSVLTIALCLVIQHPLFNALGFNVDTAIESLAIPLQQVGYIVATDGEMSDEDVFVLAQMMPVNGASEAVATLQGSGVAIPDEYKEVLLMNWKSEYGPTNVDYIKFGYTFDRAYFDSHVKDFMKTYARMVAKNPGKAIKAYLLTTMGFWDIFEETGNAYVCAESIEWTGITQTDIFENVTGVSVRKYIYPPIYISAAVCVWVMLFALFVEGGYSNSEEKGCSRKSKWKLVSIVPALGVWITIMLAVPLAFSFRYVFAVFLCIPIYLLCMMRE